jgi:hypothetical protein
MTRDHHHYWYPGPRALPPVDFSVDGYIAYETPTGRFRPPNLLKFICLLVR